MAVRINIQHALCVIQKLMSQMYDVAIVGAGLGGLVCGNILSGAGMKVIVLEKNSQLGGSMQVFSREKRIFDTGVHYVGGLDDGQILDRYFKFLKIRDKLNMIRMDDDGFDRFRFGEEELVYKYAQGLDHFTESMIEQFPGEAAAIKTYRDKIVEVCSRFPMYNLESPDAKYVLDETMSLPAAGFIESLSDNKRFTNVLSGSNLLYAGVRELSPFYQHALILNSYLMSAWKPINGGSQIATALARVIRENGGEIRKRAHVEKIDMQSDRAVVSIKGQDPVVAKKVISNVHPITTFDLVGAEKFRKSYVNRLQRLESTMSSFSVYLVLEEGKVPYENYNTYQFNMDDVWGGTTYTEDEWPNGWFMSHGASSKHLPYTDAISVLCYMHYDEVKQWVDTYNTVAEKGDRGQTYEEFKQIKIEKVLTALRKAYPELMKHVKNAYASTPLTYRDYIGSPDGAMYGFAKDYRSFLSTSVYPRTSVPNLYLTGQNVSSHGILGVTVGAVTTCFELLDRVSLIKKIISAT